MGANTVTGKGHGSAEGPVRGDINQVLKVVDSMTGLTIHDQDGQKLTLDRGAGTGGLSLTCVFTDINYNANVNEVVLADYSDTDIVIELPDATLSQDQIIIVKAAGNPHQYHLDVGGLPGQLPEGSPHVYVDGAGSYKHGSVCFISDGTQWWIFADYQLIGD